MSTNEIQKETWHFDTDVLTLRISSRGFGIDFITVWFKDEYRSLFAFEVYFKTVWTFDLLFYKFIKDK